VSFDLAALRLLAEVYPPTWTIRAGEDRIELAPGRAVFHRGELTVTLTDDGAELHSSANGPHETAIVDAIWSACREHATALAEKRAAREAALRAMPAVEGSPFDRTLFDALLRSQPADVQGWDLRLDDATSLIMQRARWNTPAHVLFVRRLKPYGQADVQKDYVRVFVHDVEGVLRTERFGETERAFVAELCARAKPALDAMLAARAERIAHAIASAPKIDRATLTDAVRAMLHGRTDAAPIVDYVLSAAEDPARFVRDNAARCREFGIHDPVEGLHVIALLQALPREHLLYFDWKESMYDVVPMLASLLRAGPGLTLDEKRWLAKCDAWDEKPRLAALREIAASLEGATLVEIKTDSDSYSFVCMTPPDAARLRSFTKKAHLPLRKL